MKDGALTLVCCGASASIGIHSHIVEIRQNIDAPLRLILTRSAEQFVAATSFNGMVDELYTAADVVNPVECAQRSVGMAVLPATANMVVTAALGIASTPAQSILMASTKPVTFFPSVNEAVLSKPIIKARIAELRDQGHIVIEPVAGRMFEMSTGTTRDGWTLPTPTAVAAIIKESINPFSDMNAGMGSS